MTEPTKPTKSLTERIYGRVSLKDDPPTSTPAEIVDRALHDPKRERGGLGDLGKAAEGLYGSLDTLRKEFRPDLNDADMVRSDRLGWKPEERQTHFDDLARAFKAAGIFNRDAGTLYAEMAKYEASPPDAETRAQWAKEVNELVRNHPLGEREAQRRLDGPIKKFLEQHPSLSKLLTASGTERHPDVVKALIERGHKLQFKSEP